MTPPDQQLEAALWMLAQLDQATQAHVRRRLSLRLNPPPSPKTLRHRELSEIAALLRSAPTKPGWAFPHVARKDYDATRTSNAPSSAALVERYGSWITVCRCASQLLAGRTPRPPSNGRQRALKMTRHYSPGDAVTALRECADELGRTPSSRAYQAWRSAAARRRRSTRYPSHGTLFSLYANRGGWIAALEDAKLVEPPTRTVRVVTTSPEQAAAIAADLRDAGVIAAHSRRSRWIEVRSRATELEASLRRLVSPLPEVTIWNPRTQQHTIIHPVDHRPTPSAADELSTNAPVDPR